MSGESCFAACEERPQIVSDEVMRIKFKETLQSILDSISAFDIRTIWWLLVKIKIFYQKREERLELARTSRRAKFVETTRPSLHFK